MPQTLDPEFWLNLSEDKLKQPDIVSQIVNMFDQPASPESQTGYLPHIMQQPVFTQPDAPVPPEVLNPNMVDGQQSPSQTWSGSVSPNVTSSDYNPETGYIKGSPGDIAVQQGRLKPFAQQQQQPAQVTPQPATAQPATSQQQSGSQSQQTTTETQTKTTDGKPVLNNYEDYLKLFQQTLGNAPELDKKRRNQLAIVAGINALGNAIKQVVNLHDRNKYGSPATPQVDQLTPALLSQYEKEYQDYMQRKDRYDLQKTNTMQEALKFAYGDKQAHEQFARQLDILGREQKYRTDETQKQRDYTTGEAQKQRDYEGGVRAEERAWRTGERKDAQADDMAQLQKQFEYEMALARERAKQTGRGTGQQKFMEDLNAGWDVIDSQTGSAVTLPNVMFWDVLTKELQRMNMTPDQLMSEDRKPSEGFRSTEEEAKAIVTSAWNKYYQPVYDQSGQQTGWGMKNQQPGTYKTIWDFIPIQDASTTTQKSQKPSYFLKD